MRIMVTGGTGFIGSHLIPGLAEEGHQIGMLVRRASHTSQFDAKNGIDSLVVDSHSDILEAFTQFQPQAVIHLATLYVNNHSPDDIQPLLESNILFGTYVLEAMSKCGIGKIINFGTRWQHMDSSRSNPANLYSATKNAFQEILGYYQNHRGISPTTLELCDTFGRGDTRKKIVGLMVDACKNREILELSPGEQVIDLLCVDDLVEYILIGLREGLFFHNETIALSGEEVSLRDLGARIEKLLGVSGCLKWGGRPYREHEVMEPPVFSPLTKISRHSLEYHLTQQFVEL